MELQGGQELQAMFGKPPPAAAATAAAPLQVGLAGPSGSGKTAFSEKIKSFIPGCALLSMDNYNDGSKVIDGNFDGAQQWAWCCQARCQPASPGLGWQWLPPARRTLCLPAHHCLLPAWCRPSHHRLRHPAGQHQGAQGGETCAGAGLPGPAAGGGC